MATTNYKIAQPELDDFYDINIANDNMTIVDNALNMLETKKMNSFQPLTILTKFLKR